MENADSLLRNAATVRAKAPSRKDPGEGKLLGVLASWREPLFQDAAALEQFNPPRDTATPRDGATDHRLPACAGSRASSLPAGEPPACHDRRDACLPDFTAPLENIIPLATTDRLASLRAMLAERFPEVPSPPRATLPTGIAPLDAPEGGLRRGALSELSGSTAAGALFIETMLLTAARERCFLALVDGARTFDPQGCAHGLLDRLLWVLCADALQAVKAADLLLRDGNLPLVLLDLQFLPARALRKIPPSTWHRFGRLVEQTGTTFVVLSPRPMVEAAGVRIAIRNHWRLDSMRTLRRELLAGLDAQVFPRRQRAPMRTQRSA